MTYDIVTRLRELAMQERPLWRSPMIEAADHIEEMYETIRQLETQLDYWIKYAHRTS